MRPAGEGAGTLAQVGWFGAALLDPPVRPVSSLPTATALLPYTGSFHASQDPCPIESYYLI